MKSFRWRLAWLAGITAAVPLLGVGFYAWRLTVRFNLDRLDRELRNFGAANLGRVVGEDHWRRAESALRFVSGGDRAPAFALRVENYGREIYRSPHWPAGIVPAQLPALVRYEGALEVRELPAPPRPGEPISARNPALPRKEPVFLTTKSGDSVWRVAVMGSPYTTLVLAANVDEFDAELAQLRTAFLAAAPVALVLIGAGAWLLARRALRPVELLTSAAERMTARGLDQRIGAAGHDREFARLVTVFNEMMDRLEQSFRQATRFSADASHELKTPLALLQAELEAAVAAAPAGSAAQQTWTSLLEEVQRLKAIVQKLLLLSLADAGRLEVNRERLDLAVRLENVIEDSAALGPGLMVERELAATAWVEGDAVLLEQALQNLAGNAVKYNRPGGRVRFALRVEAAEVVVTVGNTGPGIAAEDRPRVFERFFRGDRARTRHPQAGVGLGLSLAREIVRAHRGELELAAARDDWTEFVVRLPRAPESAAG